MPHVEGSAERSTHFIGNKQPSSNKDCVLIFDPKTGKFTLERLESNFFLKKDRKSQLNQQQPSQSQQSLALTRSITPTNDKQQSSSKKLKTSDEIQQQQQQSTTTKAIKEPNKQQQHQVSRKQSSTKKEEPSLQQQQQEQQQQPQQQAAVESKFLTINFNKKNILSKTTQKNNCIKN